MFKLQSATRGEQTALINEMIENQKVVQAYGQEKKVQTRFDEINGRLEKYSLRAIFFSSITNPATRFVNSLVYTGVGLTGAFAAVRGVMTVGQLSAFLSYANQYTKPFNEISGVITAIVLLKMIESGINRFRSVSTYYVTLIWGAVLILALVIDYVSQKPKHAK